MLTYINFRFLKIFDNQQREYSPNFLLGIFTILVDFIILFELFSYLERNTMTALIIGTVLGYFYAKNQDAINPVSYTHLTLPTKA